MENFGGWAILVGQVISGCVCSFRFVGPGVFMLEVGIDVSGEVGGVVRVFLSAEMIIPDPSCS